MKRLTAQGQLKNGDEIIIDRKRNRYFITSMVVNGDSWAQQVLIK